MTNDANPHFLTAPPFAGIQKPRIAYKRHKGLGAVNRLGIVWCGGLKSDMDGSKALALHEWAVKNDQDYVRFDYFGHGVSDGRFQDGTISRWSADTVQILDLVTDGPQILVGSSMGAWTALKAAIARPDRVKALLLIAPAPDFSEKLMWAGFDKGIKATIMNEGIYYQPSEYDEPLEITRTFILDGRDNQILDKPIPFTGPVRILQGMKDEPVPWQHALKIVDALTSEDIDLTFVKHGDHRLSEPNDIKRMLRTIEEITQALG